MEWINWKAIHTLLTAANLIVVFLVLPIVGLMRKLRSEELKKISVQIEHLHECVERRMGKLEKQIEEHIQFHLREKTK